MVGLLARHSFNPLWRSALCGASVTPCERIEKKVWMVSCTRRWGLFARPCVVADSRESARWKWVAVAGSFLHFSQLRELCELRDAELAQLVARVLSYEWILLLVPV
jgi:hypothetical protein